MLCHILPVNELLYFVPKSYLVLKLSIDRFNLSVVRDLEDCFNLSF
ncbi:hypothetical protein THF1C08_230003 [Vibrio jasicida]|nr:hypothetical protein THF1C08_230003 [Vibrio jasicida]